MKKLLLLGLLLPIGSFGQVLTEGFEGAFPPAGWTIQQSNPSQTWTHYDLEPISGNGSANIDYDEALVQQDEWLITPSMDLSGLTSAFLTFNASLSYYWAVFPNDNYDFLVKISTDNGATWTTLWTEEDEDEFESFVPFFKPINISSYTGNANVKIAFQYYGVDGAQLILDDVEVVEEFTYPTCTPVYAYVEAISNVTFAGIDNDSDPEDEMLSYEDFTAIAGNVTIGQSYPITVQGNTWGDFDTFISAYIDWNQNGSYDDAGEYYEIGVITDSDGTDGIQASGNIAVPADAMVGTTTMRIVKNYDEYAPGPCASAADGLFGQTEEYTLNVGTLGAPAFDTANFKSYPNPMNNHLNLEYANIMERVTIYNLLGQTVKAFDINSTSATLDVSTLSAGTYVVKVLSGGSVNTIKVIKK